VCVQAILYSKETTHTHSPGKSGNDCYTKAMTAMGRYYSIVESCDPMQKNQAGCNWELLGK
jgi:hypothetical protein